MALTCPKCARSTPEDKFLCQWCGAEVQATVSCPRCRRSFAASAGTCAYCGTSLAAPQAPESRTARPEPPTPPLPPDRLRAEAKSRILWGDPPAAVRADLLKQGGRAPDVDAAIREATAERKTHFRRLGFRDLLIGGLSAAGGAVAFLLGRLFDSVQRARYDVRGRGMIYLAAVALPVVAVFFIIRGVRRLLRGGAGEREASDLEADE